MILLVRAIQLHKINWLIATSSYLKFYSIDTVLLNFDFTFSFRDTSLFLDTQIVR